MKLIFLLFLLSSNLFAQDFTVRFNDLESLSALASKASDTPMSVTIEKPVNGGIGNAETDQVLAWMPIGGNDNQANFSTITTPANLPELNSAGDAYFFIDLKLTNLHTDDMYANIAVKDTNGDYKAFPLSNTDATRLVSANGTKDLRVTFKLGSMCGNISSNYCNNSTAISESYSLFFYLATSTEDNVVVTTSDKGIFLNLKTSNTLPENNFTLNSLQRGDSRLFADVQSGNTITQMGEDFLRVEVFKYGNQVEQAAQSIGAGGASSMLELSTETHSSTFDNGEVNVSGLTNDTAYNLAVTKVNKYLFAAPLSNSLVATPENIQALLEKEACYLLSAGFQREHDVINYFRHFRDNFLMSFDLGIDFVKWYYRTAPMFTKDIIESPFLSAIIRGIGYTAFYLLQYFWIFVVLGGAFLLRGKIRLVKE